MASGFDPVRTRSMSFGRVLSTTVEVIAANPIRLLVIAFFLGGLPQALLSWLQQLLQAQVRVGAISLNGFVGILLGSAVLTMMLGVLTQGALVRAALTAAEGRGATLMECLATAFARLLPLIGLAVVAGLAVGFASLLLIVPGIILYTMWTVAAPAVVAERMGPLEAMSRSSELTAGARWQVFGLNLLVFVFGLILGSISGAVFLAIYGLTGSFDMLRGGLPIGFLAINAVAQTLVAVVRGTMPTALYVELREWKEGTSANALSDIFA